MARSIKKSNSGSIQHIPTGISYGTGMARDLADGTPIQVQDLESNGRRCEDGIGKCLQANLFNLCLERINVCLAIGLHIEAALYKGCVVVRMLIDPGTGNELLPGQWPFSYIGSFLARDWPTLKCIIMALTVSTSLKAASSVASASSPDKSLEAVCCSNSNVGSTKSSYISRSHPAFDRRSLRDLSLAISSCIRDLLPRLMSLSKRPNARAYRPFQFPMGRSSWERLTSPTAIPVSQDCPVVRVFE